MLSQLSKFAVSKSSHLALIDNYEKLTYAELYRRVINLSGFLFQNLKVNSGIVVVDVKRMIPKWISILALRHNGFTTIAVSDLNLVLDLKLSGIVAVLTDSISNPTIDSIKKTVNQLSVIKLSSECFSNKNSLDSNSNVKDFGGHIEYTSGTTGIYKTILRSGNTLNYLIQRAINEFRLSEETIFFLGATHPGTGVGSKVPLGCFHLGGTCIFDHSNDPIGAFLKSNANRTFMTPLMMRAANLKLKNIEKINHSLQIYCGGGFLDPTLALEIKKRLQCSVWLNYAASECGVVLQKEVLNSEDTIWIEQLPNKVVEIVDDGLNPVNYDEEGLLRVKLDECDPDTYMNDEYASAESFRNGFFYTGDIAIRRTDGRVRIIGREKNVINLGGNKVAVEPLEQMAVENFNVSNVCLFSRQELDGSSCLLVVLETDKLPDDSSIQEFLKKITRCFTVVQIHLIKSFPIQSTGLGKIDRKGILKRLDNGTLKKTANIIFK
jgi:non-ribosomal peptide synthetase component E (peptide arylation enzyme)